MRYVRQFAPDREEAENVVAEVFYKIWKNRATLRINTSARAYLYTAVRNQALDMLRRAKSGPPPPEYAPATYVRSPEEDLIGSELQDQIQAAISRLPEQRQLIFRLNREEGLKYREIAQRLNISIKTVETQMSRSLRTLREQLPHQV